MCLILCSQRRASRQVQSAATYTACIDVYFSPSRLLPTSEQHTSEVRMTTSSTLSTRCAGPPQCCRRGSVFLHNLAAGHPAGKAAAGAEVRHLRPAPSGTAALCGSKQVLQEISTSAGTCYLQKPKAVQDRYHNQIMNTALLTRSCHGLPVIGQQRCLDAATFLADKHMHLLPESTCCVGVQVWRQCSQQGGNANEVRHETLTQRHEQPSRAVHA